MNIGLKSCFRIMVTTYSTTWLTHHDSLRRQIGFMITAQLTNQVLFPNELVTLMVNATGVPAPNFQWMKDQQLLPGAATNSLTLSNFTASTAGLYSIVVSNSAGVVTSSCQITLASTQLELALVCTDLGQPIIHGGSQGWKGDTHLAVTVSLGGINICPLP